MEIVIAIELGILAVVGILDFSATIILVRRKSAKVNQFIIPKSHLAYGTGDRWFIKKDDGSIEFEPYRKATWHTEQRRI